LGSRELKKVTEEHIMDMLKNYTANLYPVRRGIFVDDCF